jgi:ribosomal protein L37AE/L43A
MADNAKTTYCMSCGAEKVRLRSLLGGWYCEPCKRELEGKGIKDAD